MKNGHNVPLDIDAEECRFLTDLILTKGAERLGFKVYIQLELVADTYGADGWVTEYDADQVEFRLSIGTPGGEDVELGSQPKIWEKYRDRIDYELGITERLEQTLRESRDYEPEPEYVTYD